LRSIKSGAETATVGQR